jgi:hypothetical protein
LKQIFFLAVHVANPILDQTPNSTLQILQLDNDLAWINASISGTPHQHHGAIIVSMIDFIARELSSQLGWVSRGIKYCRGFTDL